MESIRTVSWKKGFGDPQVSEFEKEENSTMGSEEEMISALYYTAQEDVDPNERSGSYPFHKDCINKGEALAHEMEAAVKENFYEEQPLSMEKSNYSPIHIEISDMSNIFATEGIQLSSESHESRAYNENNVVASSNCDKNKNAEPQNETMKSAKDIVCAVESFNGLGEPIDDDKRDDPTIPNLASSEFSQKKAEPEEPLQPLKQQTSFQWKMQESVKSMMQKESDSIVMWLTAEDAAGLISIPWSSEDGLWGAWTDRGLCFLLNMEGCITSLPYSGEEGGHLIPFVIVGMHEMNDMYFTKLKKCTTLSTRTPFDSDTLVTESEEFSASDTQKSDTFMDAIRQSDRLKTRSSQLKNDVTQDTVVKPKTMQSRTLPSLLSFDAASSLSLYRSTFGNKVGCIEWTTAVLSFERRKIPPSRLRATRSDLMKWNTKDLRGSNSDERSKSESVKRPRKIPNTNWEWEKEYSVDEMNALNQEMELPEVLAEECAILAGRKKATSLRCNVSLANHRINAALNQSYKYEVDELRTTHALEKQSSTEEGVADVIGVDEVESANVDETCANLESGYTLQALPTVIREHIPPNDGALVRVSYPNEFPGLGEEDIVYFCGKDVIAKCLNKAVELSEDGNPDLSPMNLAQVAYRLFWSLAIISKGHVERLIDDLVPMAASKRFRRKCPWNREINKSIHEKRLRLEAYKQKVLENIELRKRDLEVQFEEMNAKLIADAEIKRKRRLELHEEQTLKYGKKYRHPPLSNSDEKGIIEGVLDERTGIFLRPIISLTESQRRCVYQECIRQNITAAVKLTRTEKGRGVLAADLMRKDDFVLEYRGELISEKEARKRDSKYNRSRTQKGSFMFYFKHNSKNFSIDATSESAALGPARLINHSKINPNLVAKTICVDDVARLFFCAKRNIQENEELLVDYGERDPEVIQKHPWLNS